VELLRVGGEGGMTGWGLKQLLQLLDATSWKISKYTRREKRHLKLSRGSLRGWYGCLPWASMSGQDQLWEKDAKEGKEGHDVEKKEVKKKGGSCG